MIKFLTAHGNSSAIILDKSILELLNISQNTPLEVSTDGKNLIISPIQKMDQAARVKNALKKVNERHAKSLKKLAE